MANFHVLIHKLIKAVRLQYDIVLLYSTEQKVSEETGKVYTVYSLSLSMTTEEYNERFPNQRKNPKIHKSRYASLLLIRTVKQGELFNFLHKEIWNKLNSGEMYEQGKREIAKIRSRYYPGRREGTGGSEGVLQDASPGEELAGGVPKDK